MVATCTGGERGAILNPTMERPESAANLAELRRAEMAEAARILGIEQVWLGFVDSGLPEGDPLPPLPEGCFAIETSTWLRRLSSRSSASSVRTCSPRTTRTAATRTRTTSCATR